MKRTVVSLVLALVLVVGTWFVFSNSHIDILPCEKANFNYETGKTDAPTSGTCSLLGVYQAKNSKDLASLTPVGWGVGVLVIVIVPGLIGWFVGRKLIKP